MLRKTLSDKLTWKFFDVSLLLIGTLVVAMSGLISVLVILPISTETADQVAVWMQPQEWSLVAIVSMLILGNLVAVSLSLRWLGNRWWKLARKPGLRLLLLPLAIVTIAVAMWSFFFIGFLLRLLENVGVY